VRSGIQRTSPALRRGLSTGRPPLELELAALGGPVEHLAGARLANAKFCAPFLDRSPCAVFRQLEQAPVELLLLDLLARVGLEAVLAVVDETDRFADRPVLVPVFEVPQARVAVGQPLECEDRLGPARQRPGAGDVVQSELAVALASERLLARMRGRIRPKPNSARSASSVRIRSTTARSSLASPRWHL
jgi:hypothetical protein